MRALDSSIEEFFKTREANLKNFNFLLNILSEKRDYQTAKLVFEKMSLFNIRPNVTSFSNMIVLCGKIGKIKESESLFNEGLNKFNHNKVLYNSLIYAYSRVPDPMNAI